MFCIICAIVFCVILLLVIAVVIFPFFPEGSTGIVVAIFLVSIAAFIYYRILNYKPRILT